MAAEGDNWFEGNHKPNLAHPDGIVITSLSQSEPDAYFAEGNAMIFYAADKA